MGEPATRLAVGEAKVNRVGRVNMVNMSALTICMSEAITTLLLSLKLIETASNF
jgi:hypothetical protein